MNITIIGGGFAGVKLALELAHDNRNSITMITDRPVFQYFPAMYNSATGKSHLESWVPLGEIFAGHDNIKVHIDRIVGIDAKRKICVGASEATYQYTTLVIAVGMVTTYFNIPGLDQYSYGIKSAEEIRRLKERLYHDLSEHKALDKNYVVVGGGPTGTELAGALGAYIRRLARYHGITRPRVRIRLIEAAPRLLPRSHPTTSRKVQQRLEKLGVDVQTGVAVQKATAQALIVGGRPIATHTVIWTSGVTNNPLFAAHPEIFQLAKNGRVEVDQYMRAHKNIYVIGDNAATPYSGLAQTALHDAKYLARQLQARKKSRPVKPYRPVQPATVVPIGRRWAAFEWRWIRFYGLIAALLRRCADFIGYSDVLPLGQALRPWYASSIDERDYFEPRPHRRIGKKPRGQSKKTSGKV